MRLSDIYAGHRVGYGVITLADQDVHNFLPANPKRAAIVVSTEGTGAYVLGNGPDATQGGQPITWPQYAMQQGREFRMVAKDFGAIIAQPWNIFCRTAALGNPVSFYWVELVIIDG